MTPNQLPRILNWDKEGRKFLMIQDDDTGDDVITVFIVKCKVLSLQELAGRTVARALRGGGTCCTSQEKVLESMSRPGGTWGKGGKPLKKEVKNWMGSWVGLDGLAYSMEASKPTVDSQQFDNNSDNQVTSFETSESEDEFLLKAALDWEKKIHQNLNRRDGIEEEPRRMTLDWGIGGTLWTREEIIQETIRESMLYIRMQNMKSRKCQAVGTNK